MYAEPLLTPEEASSIVSTAAARPEEQQQQQRIATPGRPKPIPRTPLPRYSVAYENTSTKSAEKGDGVGEHNRREAEALAVLLAEDGPLFGAIIDSSGNDGEDTASGHQEGHEEVKDDEKEELSRVSIWRAAKPALTRLAARYLVRETVRGKILDPVGNFHVRMFFGMYQYVRAFVWFVTFVKRFNKYSLHWFSLRSCACAWWGSCLFVPYKYVRFFCLRCHLAKTFLFIVPFQYVYVYFVYVCVGGPVSCV